MTWSYAGLVAAGCGQSAVAVGQDLAAWVVPVVIAAVLSISGVVIFGRVPSTLDRILAE
jgi:cytochrome b subunit of formate dehydrogenase